MVRKRGVVSSPRPCVSAKSRCSPLVLSCPPWFKRAVTTEHTEETEIALASVLLRRRLDTHVRYSAIFTASRTPRFRG